MTSPQEQPYRSVLITGASGYIGRQLVAALSRDRRSVETIVAADVRLPESAARDPGIEYAQADIRTADLTALFRQYGTDVVVHLAAVVTPGRNSNRQLEYEVDVLGTERVLKACREAAVRKLVYTSSGAAYGYHADNPAWLVESDPLRGNEEFAYSHHKRLVEQMLERWRNDHPALRQLVFRACTILGETTRNQITDLFDGRFVLGLRGAQTPFVLIWDQDIVGALLHGVHEGGTGIYNLAGDGSLSLCEMAAMLEKPYVEIPVTVMTAALYALKAVGLSQYGPEQVGFLRYRPVLDNRRLKEELGYIPRKTTRQTFELFVSARRRASSGDGLPPARAARDAP